jgi:chromosome segregation ATPase
MLQLNDESIEITLNEQISKQISLCLKLINETSQIKINDLKSKLSIEKELVKINKEEKRSLEIENNNLRDEISHLMNTYNGSNQTVDKLKKENSYLRQEIVCLNSALNEINLDIKTDKSETIKVINYLKTRISKFVIKYNELNMKINDYEKNLIASKKNNSDLLIENKRTTSQLNDLIEKVKQSQLINESIDELKNRFQNQLLHNACHLTEVKNKVNNFKTLLNEEKSKLKVELASQEKLFNAKINAKLIATDKILKQKREIFRLNSCIKKQNEKLNILNRELNKCNSQIIQILKENSLLRINIIDCGLIKKT